MSIIYNNQLSPSGLPPSVSDQPSPSNRYQSDSDESPPKRPGHNPFSSSKTQSNSNTSSPSNAYENNNTSGSSSVASDAESLPLPKLTRTYDPLGQLLREDVSKTRGWTPLAKKYTHPMGTFASENHRLLKGTGKSGLTPLSPFHASPNAQKLQQFYHQRSRFFGFSAAELHDMEVLAALHTDAVTNTLGDVPVHVLFQKSRWEKESKMMSTRAPIPIRGGHDGYWLAENPVVWEVIKPAIKLASIAIRQAHCFEWWDALFSGKLKEVDIHRIPFTYLGDPLHTFQPPPKSTSSYNETKHSKDMQRKFRMIAGSLNLALYSGYTHELSQMPYKDEDWDNAETLRSLLHEKQIRVGLAIENVQPLLRFDLTDSERACSYFTIASALLHEIAHASWHWLEMQKDIKKDSDREPYFKDERIAELGWSMEEKLWKTGYPIFLPDYSRGGPGLPQLGLINMNWFNARHGEVYNGGSSVVLEEEQSSVPSNSFNHLDYFPVPISWSHNILQADLWNNHIRQYGQDAAAMGPITFGTRLRAEDHEHLNNLRYNRSFSKLISKYSGPMPHTRMNTTPRERWQNAQFEKAAKIARALFSHRKEKFYPCSTFLIPGQFPPPAEEYESDTDSMYSDGYNDDYENPLCPRWEEITEYMFRNRGPGELALDTMTFDIPEHVLYKYILQRGGLDITAEEFRDFLAMAHKKLELFRWYPFPGVGIVTRIKNGWPPAQVYIIEPADPPPNAKDFEAFKKAIQHWDFHRTQYDYFAEFRDVDYETYRQIHNSMALDPQYDVESIGGKESIRRCLIEYARTAENPRVTLGPNKVARLLGDTTSFRLDYGTDYTRNKFRYDEMLNDEEKKRLKEVKKRAHDAVDSTSESSAIKFAKKKKRLDKANGSDAVFAAADAAFEAAGGGLQHSADEESDSDGGAPLIET